MKELFLSLKFLDWENFIFFPLENDSLTKVRFCAISHSIKNPTTCVVGKIGILFLASAPGIAIALDITQGGRIEFVDGERHMFEHFAGIVGGGRNAFLFGNGIFRAVHEILRGALDAHHGEEAERDGKHLAAVFVGKSAVHAIADGFGEILHMEVAMVAKLARIENTGCEDEGIHDLKNGGGQIVAGAFRMAAAAEIRACNVALEDVDVALAAVENDLFLHYGNAVGFLRSSHAGADLHGDFDIHGNADLVKASVERHVVNVDVCAEDLCAFGADRGSAFQ